MTLSANSPQSGYTLPVFACAAAIAALQWLRHRLVQFYLTATVPLLSEAKQQLRYWRNYVKFVKIAVHSIRDQKSLCRRYTAFFSGEPFSRNGSLWKLLNDALLLQRFCRLYT